MPYELAEPTPPVSDATERSARIYLAIVLTGISILVCFLAFLALRLGPPIGDLGRISGLGSKAYGHQENMQAYAKSHFSTLTVDALIAGADPSDILIFGDSFSRQTSFAGNVSWINTLYAETGLQARSVIGGAEFTNTLLYLQSQAFTQHPPKAIIIESVERNLLQRAATIYDPAICPAPRPTAPTTIAPIPLQTPPVQIGITTQHSFGSINDILSWGSLALRKRLSDTSSVVEVSLTRDDLFSNAKSDNALIYVDDFRKFTPGFIARLAGQTPEDHIRCGLARLLSAQDQVPLWMLIAPDKRTIYEPWFAASQTPKPVDVFDLAQQALGPAFINIKPLLQQSATDGQTDIYWPNDSHWAARGHQMVGRHVAKHLTGP